MYCAINERTTPGRWSIWSNTQDIYWRIHLYCGVIEPNLWVDHNVPAPIASHENVSQTWLNNLVRDAIMSPEACFQTLYGFRWLLVAAVLLIMRKRKSVLTNENYNTIPAWKQDHARRPGRMPVMWNADGRRYRASRRFILAFLSRQALLHRVCSSSNPRFLKGRIYCYYY